MRIALLHDDFPPFHEGGSGVIARQLAKGYAALGHEVLVITTVREPSDAGSAREEGYRVERLVANYAGRWRAYRSLYNPRVARRAGELLRQFSPDIVHAHNVHTFLSYYSLAYARKYARAVFLTAHDTMMVCQGKLPSASPDTPAPGPLFESGWSQFRRHGLRYNPLRTRVIRRIVRRNVDGVIAVSEALARALSAGGILGLRVIHNGIDPDEWREPEGVEAFRARLGIGKHAILFGGRLSAAKGAYALADALLRAARSVPDAQLVVIGKKDAVSLRMAERLGKDTRRLVFTGWLTGAELRRAYYSCALVATPSIYLDPFPTVNLEAFACKKPVVATRFGGSSEIVENGASGFIENPLDADAFAARLVELLTDDAKRAAFGAAGFARVTSEFTLAGQITAYEALFAHALRGAT